MARDGKQSFVWHPLLTTTIDRRSRTVTVLRNSFYTKAVEFFRYDQVRVFEAEKSPDEDDLPQFRLQMLVENNSPVIISTIYHNSRRKIDKWAETANSFIQQAK